MEKIDQMLALKKSIEEENRNEYTFDKEIEFERMKDNFLDELITTYHISDIEEDPQDLFKKLIELYGEEELADFTYYEYDFDVEEYGEEELEDFSVNEYDYEVEYTRDLSNFIAGEEDNLIDLVSNNKLRQTLLASKLSSIRFDVDIARYIQEYADSNEYGDELVYLDEYGEVNLEDTLLYFSQLPICKDMNFYLCLAEHLDEMQMPFEIFIKYIDPEMREELINKINGKELDKADKELEAFYAKNPELDDRPDSQIPEGMTIEEYSEIMAEEIETYEDKIIPEREVNVSEVKNVATKVKLTTIEETLRVVTMPDKEFVKIKD